MRKILFSYYLYIFLCSFGNSIVGANAVIYVKEFLPLLPWQQSLLLSLGPVLMGLLDYPLGNVADFWGIKRTMISGFLMVGLASVTYSLSKNFSILIVAIFFIALGTALISGTGQSWLHHALRDHDKEIFKKTLSRGVLISRSTNLGAALLAPSLIHLAQNLPFLIHGIVFVFGGVVLSLIVNKDFYLNMKQSKNPSFYFFLKANTGGIFKSVLIRRMMLITVCEMIFLAVFLFSWQVLVAQEFQTKPSMLGVVYIFLRVVLLLIGVIFHKVGRKFRTQTVLKFYVGLMVLGGSLLCLKGSFLVCGLVILEMAIGLISHQNSLLFNELISSGARTSVFSAISTIASLALALTFFVMNYFSSEWVLKCLVFSVLLAIVGILGFYRKIIANT